jgi:signal transduction histidine kinase
VSGLRLQERVLRAAQAFAYLAVSVPIAILGGVGVVALVVAAALTALGGLGLPGLLAVGAACRRLLRVDRRLANQLLEANVPPQAQPVRATGELWQRSVTVLSDRGLWRVAATLALKPLLTLGLLVVALVPVAFLGWLLSLGIQAVLGLGGLDYFGPWSFGPLLGLALLAFALPTAVLAIATLDGLRSALCAVTRGLLAPRAAPAGPVREILAESLGDLTVAVAYWLPDREVFVDEAGRPIELPDPASGRAWTAIERDGQPVAAIVHDAALDTTPELVQAAATASSLAIDNERLKADLRARVEELRVSRLRIVEATDAARRRIERDLHDGAQQQLVALALELRLLRKRVTEPELQPLVDGLSARLTAALEELRALARGIHPSILTERGLAPALSDLASRGPLDARPVVEIEARLPAAIEAAVYFLVAEGLTNVTKYAGVREARVVVRREGDDVVVLVADDGAGGASVEGGTGLRGLQDRLAAVDGTLTIDSPPGGGTVLLARIPCPVELERPRAPEAVGA